MFKSDALCNIFLKEKANCNYMTKILKIDLDLDFEGVLRMKIYQFKRHRSCEYKD